MIRDVNNVRGALNSAARMGVRGDDSVVHAGTGEMVLPPSVIDQQPAVMGPLIKAFQNAGIDWRKYLVGSPTAQKNPKTGAQMFPEPGGVGEGPGAGGFGGDTNDGYDEGLSAEDIASPSGGVYSDIGDASEAVPPPGIMVDPVNYAQEYTDVAAATGYDPVDPGAPSLLQSVKDATKGLQTAGAVGTAFPPAAVPAAVLGLGSDIYRGLTAPPSYSDLDPSKPSVGVSLDDSNRDGPDAVSTGGGLAKDLAPPAPAPGTPAVPVAVAPAAAVPTGPVSAPGYLQMDPSMTGLQRRAQIATFGVNADDSRYTAEETQTYYKSLLRESLVGATTLDSILPIERQYMEQVLGITMPNNIGDLMTILGGQSLQPGGGGSPVAGV